MLEYGAPAGIYDDCGTSALSLMIEKMPDVAKEALGQFQMVDNALRRKYYYLNYLELETWRAVGSKKGKPLRQSFARSPLEVKTNFSFIISTNSRIDSYLLRKPRTQIKSIFS